MVPTVNERTYEIGDHYYIVDDNTITIGIVVGKIVKHEYNYLQVSLGKQGIVEINDLNKHLEMAGRVADFLELGELMARDALMREESCGGHFREEHKTEDGEAKRDDKNYTFVSAWEHTGEDQEPVMHKEDLVFENVELKTRSYK